MNDAATKKKSKLTLELEKETLAELKAAAIIFGAKSYSSLVHQQVVLKIREAKQMVPKEEFEKLRDEQMEALETLSRIKAAERRKIEAGNPAGEEVVENFESAKKPVKKAAGKNSNSITTKGGETLRFVEEDEGFTGDK